MTGLLIIGLSIAFIVYGLYLRLLFSADEVFMRDVYHWDGDPGRFLLMHERDVSKLMRIRESMLIRKSRSKKCIIGGFVGLFFGAIATIIGLIR